jgi:hypothetical protein
VALKSRSKSFCNPAKSSCSEVKPTCAKVDNAVAHEWPPRELAAVNAGTIPVEGLQHTTILALARGASSVADYSVLFRLNRTFHFDNQDERSIHNAAWRGEQVDRTDDCNDNWLGSHSNTSRYKRKAES